MSAKEITIAGRKIGPGHPCFIVAELSGNHHQSYAEAVALVKAAAKAGADAVKLQTYTPDTMTLDSRQPWFLVGGKGNPRTWKGKTLHELYETAYTPWDWQPKLKRLADKLGILLFSTPFDATAVDFLEKMKVKFYKVASYEATDIPLLKKIAKTGKPVILSIGYASRSEAALAVRTLRSAGAKDIAVLHCVTGYARRGDLSAMNLSTIRDIRDRFGVVAGFSDNNGGMEAPVAAALYGASIVEKHLILSRKDGGPDARFSVEPAELRRMVAAIRRQESPRGLGRSALASRRLEASYGRPFYGPATALERYNLRFRRSVFAVRDIEKGERFTTANIRCLRPADGLEPRHYDEVLGRKAARDIERGTPLAWRHVR